MHARHVTVHQPPTIVDAVGTVQAIAEMLLPQLIPESYYYGTTSPYITKT